MSVSFQIKQLRYPSSAAKNHPPLAEAVIHILKQIFIKARCLVILWSCHYPLAGATIHVLKLTKKSLAIFPPLRVTNIQYRSH